MKKALGAQRVAPPEDKLYGDWYDLMNDAVFNRKKKEAKDRKVFANHYAPTCRTFSAAQAQHQQRSMQSPYGDYDKVKGPIRDSVVEDSKLAVRVIALCKIHHALGDAFSIEHCWPTAMLQFASMQELLKMPGVFVLTWDNCEFGEQYRH